MSQISTECRERSLLQNGLEVLLPFGFHANPQLIQSLTAEMTKTFSCLSRARHTTEYEICWFQ
jgi:hypothetical protein